MNDPYVAIADSSWLISLFIATDSNYKSALRIRNEFEEHSGTLHIPSEVFSETINILGKKFGHTSSSIVANKILALDDFIITESNHEIRMNAVAKFKKQPASVSFTDCLVMAFADHLETKEIFGFDRSFSQNGYQLLK